jgi:hypothetical protein
MSYGRKMTRPDATQGAVVEGLRKAGISVWILGEPCDLLTYYPPLKRWRPIEVKPEDTHNRNRRDQETQKEFLATYAVPIVRTAQEALSAVLAP